MEDNQAESGRGDWNDCAKRVNKLPQKEGKEPRKKFENNLKVGSCIARENIVCICCFLSSLACD